MAKIKGKVVPLEKIDRRVRKSINKLVENIDGCDVEYSRKHPYARLIPHVINHHRCDYCGAQEEYYRRDRYDDQEKEHLNGYGHDASGKEIMFSVYRYNTPCLIFDDDGDCVDLGTLLLCEDCLKEHQRNTDRIKAAIERMVDDWRVT